MSDVQANETEPVEEPVEDLAEESEPTTNAQLREAYNRQKADADAGKQAQKELAFLRAGVDSDASPAAKFFTDHYDGELTAEAIKESYTALGLGGEPAGDPEPEVDPTIAEDQAKASAVNSALGSEPVKTQSELEGPNPYREIRETVDKGMTEGLGREDQYPMAVGMLMDRFRKGDPRVVTSREKTNAEVQALRDRGVDVR